MATLASQIATDLAVLVASANIIDLSNQRDTDATEDTTRTARVCAMAAAKVQSYLGDVDGTDLQAVDIGVRLAAVYYSASYPLLSTKQDVLSNIYAELAELRESRLSEVEPQLGEVDLTNLDAVYPTEPEWNTEED